MQLCRFCGTHFFGVFLLMVLLSLSQMLCIENPYEDPRFNFSIDQARKFVTRNLLCMPIVVDGRTLGVTQIINKIKGSFGREDEGLLAAFSSFCGITLHNASLYKRSMEARDKTRALLNVALALTEGGSDNAVIADIMEEARYLIGAERCSLFLVDTETRTLRTKVSGLPLGAGLASLLWVEGMFPSCFNFSDCCPAGCADGVRHRRNMHSTALGHRRPCSPDWRSGGV